MYQHDDPQASYLVRGAPYQAGGQSTYLKTRYARTVSRTTVGLKETGRLPQTLGGQSPGEPTHTRGSFHARSTTVTFHLRCGGHRRQRLIGHCNEEHGQKASWSGGRCGRVRGHVATRRQSRIGPSATTERLLRREPPTRELPPLTQQRQLARKPG